MHYRKPLAVSMAALAFAALPRVLFAESLSVIGAGGVPAASSGVQWSQDLPNVIIVLADDLGYGDVSLNNAFARTHTPHIDALGRGGIRFTEAHSGGATCIPSRYALLTGRFFFRSDSHGIRAAELGGGGYLPPLIEEGRETIGTLMKRAGYDTAIIGKWHLGQDWALQDGSRPPGLLERGTASRYTNTDFSKGTRNGPNSRGFDYAFIIPASASAPPFVFMENGRVLDPDMALIPDLYPARRDNTVVDWDVKHVDGPGDVYWERGVIFKNGEISRSFRIEDCADRILEEARRYIRDRSVRRKPFLLYLALTGPHTPWMPVEKFRGKSDVGTYGDWVLQMDDAVGEVRRELAAAGLEQNTIFIFSSDNGAHWREEDIRRTGHRANFPRRGNKADIWDGGHHVPLLISWPEGIASPAEYGHSVSLNDILATLAELTGQPLADNAGEDSVSFFPVLQGRLESPVRDSIIYAAHGRQAIARDGWKYIPGAAGLGPPRPVQPEGPNGELYQIRDDPSERINLYHRHPEKVRELAALLEAQIRQGFSASRLSRPCGDP